MSKPPSVMTLDQAAEYLQQHRRTVLRHIRAGKILATKTGDSPCAPWRILRSEVDAFLRGRRP